jgi:MYXO-CTERM domain-containing protein
MKKHIMQKRIAGGILALGLIAGPMAGMATAHQSTGYQGSQTVENAQREAQQRINNEMPKKDSDWGWLGLIGLGGLAGLLRRPHSDESVRQRTGYRSSEPLSSR